MLLSELISHPYHSRFHLEKYVNDGSPSGFSTQNTTRPSTNPFEHNSWFCPLICTAPSSYFKEYGDIPDIVPPQKGQNWIIVHPDMTDNQFFKYKDFDLRTLYGVQVLPTASGRTVQIYNDNKNDYIKLHYEGILGRIRRELPYFKSISGVEMSKYIATAISNNQLNDKISILPEIGARVLINKDYKYNEWGMIWRENEPLKLKKDNYHFLFPSFSFFSMDRFYLNHLPLLQQIISHYHYNPTEYILEVVLLPLVDCYFSFVLKLGLQPELNSQNMMFGFNKDFSECSFIIRDLESIDKDLTLMKYLGISFESEVYPYKCIEEKQYNYQIKHSFMYDFKLGESILDPIIKTTMKYFNTDYNEIIDKIKTVAHTYIKQLPNAFFPNNKWYVFDRVLVDQTKLERPYIKYSNPKFR